MTEAAYRNFDHYVVDEWKDRAPKDMFKTVMDLMEERGVEKKGACLDIGCATGEFIYFLRQRFPEMDYTGCDVFDELINTAQNHQPDVTFKKENVLDLSSDMNDAFDVTLAIGVMSIFDETQIEDFWENLLRVTKKGGAIFVLSPLNEFGVDAMIRHRKRVNGERKDWETGWNIFARETIEELLGRFDQTMETVPFNISFDLERRDDPIRTWTMNTDNKERQLTNGLKLLVDHQVMIVKKT